MKRASAPQHSKPHRTAASIAAVTAAACLSLLVSACGSTKTHHAVEASASGAESSAVAFSQCMRAHGLSSFPDPTTGGQIPKSEVSPLARSPQFPAAQRACQHLLPQTPRAQSTYAEVRAALAGMVRFAACMRSHGVQSWPDPYVDRSRPGDPRPTFDLHASINPNAPQIKTDMQDCEHVMPQSTSPYICSRILAEQIPGSPPGAEACGGGSPQVP